MRRIQFSIFILCFMLVTACDNSVDEVIETPLASNEIDNATVYESIEVVQNLMDSKAFGNFNNLSEQDLISQLSSVIPDSLGIQQKILEDVQQIEFAKRLPHETTQEYLERAGVSTIVAEKFELLEEDITSLEGLEEEFVSSDGFIDVEKPSDSVKDKFIQTKESIMADNSLDNMEKLSVLTALEIMIGMSDEIVMMAVDAHSIEDDDSPVARTEGLFKKIGKFFKKVVSTIVKVTAVAVGYTVVGALKGGYAGLLLGGLFAGGYGAMYGVPVGATFGAVIGLFSEAGNRILQNDCEIFGECW